MVLFSVAVNFLDPSLKSHVRKISLMRDLKVKTSSSIQGCKPEGSGKPDLSLL